MAYSKFQHTAARRRLGKRPRAAGKNRRSFNTQPPEGGCAVLGYLRYYQAVSTHSRPKAAAVAFGFWGLVTGFQHTAARRRLNVVATIQKQAFGFNTQPPEGGCIISCGWAAYAAVVSTHSRPKAAGRHRPNTKPTPKVSTHSRPKAAGISGGSWVCFA